MNAETAAGRYRRRRRWPILLALVVLAAGTAVLWLRVLQPPAAAATGCNQPGPAPSTAVQTTRSDLSRSGSGSAGAGSLGAGSLVSASGSRGASTGARASAPRSTGAPSSRATGSAGTTAATPSVTTVLGSFVAAQTLALTRPADPSTVPLRVVNASATRGQAGTLTKNLQDAGFDSIADASNDTLYPAHDLVCATEIRFGAAGLPQARTVLIVAPCAQLVMDDRIDQTVDLALGRNYSYVAATDVMKQQLKTLHDAAAPVAVIEGQTAAPRPLASIPPLPAADCSGTARPSS